MQSNFNTRYHNDLNTPRFEEATYIIVQQRSTYVAFHRNPNTSIKVQYTVPAHHTNTRKAIMRIPFALQTVFLQSQAGEDVEKIAAPSDGTAGKAYPPKVPKARGADASKNKGPMKKIGYRPVTNRQTAMSLKIFNRLSKHVTTAADATKARLWDKKPNVDASEELWVSLNYLVR